MKRESATDMMRALNRLAGRVLETVDRDNGAAAERAADDKPAREGIINAAAFVGVSVAVAVDRLLDGQPLTTAGFVRRLKAKSDLPSAES